MLVKTETVQVGEGLDAGVIAVLVQRACKYDCKVYLEADGKKVNAKSIMGMMNLGIAKGKEIKIITDGSDEENAGTDLADYIAGKEA